MPARVARDSNRVSSADAMFGFEQEERGRTRLEQELAGQSDHEVPFPTPALLNQPGRALNPSARDGRRRQTGRNREILLTRLRPRC